MKILFLDDDNYRFSLFKRENPNVDVDWAIDYETGVNYVRNNNYDVIYLDHDLGWYEPTGKDFVNYMINLHSQGYFLQICKKWIGQAGVNTSMLLGTEIKFPSLENQIILNLFHIYIVLGLC